MLRKIFLITTTAISAFALHMTEININDKDLELSAKLDMGQFNESVEPGTIFIGARLLSGDKDYASLSSGTSIDRIDPFYEVNFLMMKAVGNMGMHFGMGAKLNYTKDYSAIPLGIEFEYDLPTEKLIPMYVNGSVYYAPGVLSLSDAKNFLEYRVSYDVEVIQSGRVTIGYRSINTNYDAGDMVYNESFYLGFKIAF